MFGLLWRDLIHRKAFAADNHDRRTKFAVGHCFSPMKVDTCNYVHFVLAGVNIRCPMRADDLTADQADNLNSEIHRMAYRVYELMRRMEQLKFEPDDKLFVAIQAAEKSLKAL